MNAAGRPELKICGTTSAHDAGMLHGSGADYCGFLVEVDFSPRSLTLETARDAASEIECKPVVLLCHPSLDLCLRVWREMRPFAVQLLADESPDFVARVRRELPLEIWKTLHLPRQATQSEPEAYVEAGADRLLFDTRLVRKGRTMFGGTGVTGDWDLIGSRIAALPDVPCFLSGGLRPGNLHAAVAAVSPAGLDLCSGIERRTGVRDAGLLQELLREWRNLPMSSEKENAGRGRSRSE